MLKLISRKFFLVVLRAFSNYYEHTSFIFWKNRNSALIVNLFHPYPVARLNNPHLYPIKSPKNLNLGCNGVSCPLESHETIFIKFQLFEASPALLKYWLDFLYLSFTLKYFEYCHTFFFFASTSLMMVEIGNTHLCSIIVISNNYTSSYQWNLRYFWLLKTSSNCDY